MYMLSMYIFVHVDMYSINNLSLYYNCLLSNISNNHFMKFNYIKYTYFIKDYLFNFPLSYLFMYIPIVYI